MYTPAYNTLFSLLVFLLHSSKEKKLTRYRTNELFKPLKSASALVYTSNNKHSHVVTCSEIIEEWFGFEKYVRNLAMGACLKWLRYDLR